MEETIYAFATPEGRSALAVLRISGSQCRTIIAAMMTRAPVAREATLVKLRAPRSCEVLDQAIVLWHPGPASFTGEDCLEFHVHGGRAVKKAVLQALSHIEDCRIADPGEFTRRAFLNGKTDLARLEGLADLLEAETEAQRRQAFAQLDGKVSDQCDLWREELLEIMALLEATIDFSDEGDAPVDVLEGVRARVLRLRGEIEHELVASAVGEVLREGFRVVIAGPPNAGKSSLLNALARRDIAIVTDIPGTTRDVLEVPMDIGGLLVRFADTAGIRESNDPVERAGVARARLAGRKADLLLWLRPVGVGGDCPLESLGAVLSVNTKSDLHEGALLDQTDGVWVSSKTGSGLENLLKLVGASAGAAVGGQGGATFSQARHQQCLSDCSRNLEQALNSLGGRAAELVCEELRGAAEALGRLAGRIGTEEILGTIFARFCIGK